jgi:hypothetical protein
LIPEGAWGCSSMGERSVRIRKVGGSSPLSSTMVTSRETPVGVFADGSYVARVYSFAYHERHKEVKSCATERCSTPPGPEGSNGRLTVSCDTVGLALRDLA